MHSEGLATSNWILLIITQSLCMDEALWLCEMVPCDTYLGTWVGSLFPPAARHCSAEIWTACLA